MFELSSSAVGVNEWTLTDGIRVHSSSPRKNVRLVSRSTTRTGSAGSLVQDTVQAAKKAARLSSVPVVSKKHPT